MIPLSTLIPYLVSELEDMESSFGKTKMVKLLYLIDVEYYRRYSTTLTGLKWKFYHYGPYAAEIDTALTRLDLEIPSEDTLTARGHRAVIFKSQGGAADKFEDTIPIKEKRVVDRIIKAWGMEDLNPLLNYVYFHTEPMAKAKRGDALDFSSIRQIRSLATEKQKVKIPDDLLNELRSKFQKMKAERSQQKAQLSLDPKPRYDDLYWHSLNRLEQEEQYRIPNGDIELPEAFKDLLRQELDLG